MRRFIVLLGVSLFALGGIVSSASATVLIFDQFTQLLPPPTPGVLDEGYPVNQGYGDRVDSTTLTSLGGGYYRSEQSAPPGTKYFDYFVDPTPGVNDTPNVVVGYFPVAVPADNVGMDAPRLWRNDFGDLTNVAYLGGDDNGSVFEIVLYGDPFWDVALQGFDMAGWSHADYTIPSVRVYDLSTNAVLYEATDVLIEGDGTGPEHTTFAFGPPLVAHFLGIRIDVGATDEVIGIDNISFLQIEGEDGTVGHDPSYVPEPGALAIWSLLGAVGVSGGWLRRRKTR